MLALRSRWSHVAPASASAARAGLAHTWSTAQAALPTPAPAAASTSVLTGSAAAALAPCAPLARAAAAFSTLQLQQRARAKAAPALGGGLSPSSSVRSGRPSGSRLSQPLPHSSLMMLASRSMAAGSGKGGDTSEPQRQAEQAPADAAQAPTRERPAAADAAAADAAPSSSSTSTSVASSSSSSVTSASVSFVSPAGVVRGLGKRSRSASSTGVARSDRISLQLAAAKQDAMERRAAGTYDEQRAVGQERSPSTPSGLVVGWQFPAYFDPRFEPPPLNAFRKDPKFKFLLFDPAMVGGASNPTASSIRMQMDEAALVLWHQRYQHWISARAKRNEHVARQRKEYVAEGHPTRLTSTEQEFDAFVRTEAFHAYLERVQAEDHSVPVFDPALEPSAMFPFAQDPDEAGAKYHPSFEPVAPEIWNEYNISARDSDEYAAWFHAWLEANPAVARQREVYQRLVAKYVGPVWRARMSAETDRILRNELTRSELIAMKEAEALERAIAPPVVDAFAEDVERVEELESTRRMDEMLDRVDPLRPFDPRMSNTQEEEEALTGDPMDGSLQDLDEAMGTDRTKLLQHAVVNVESMVTQMKAEAQDIKKEREDLQHLSPEEVEEYKRIEAAQIDPEDVQPTYIQLAPQMERELFRDRFAVRPQVDEELRDALKPMADIADTAVARAWFRVQRALDRANKDGRDEAKKDIKAKVMSGELKPTDADREAADRELHKELTLLRTLPMHIYRRVVHNRVARDEELTYEHATSSAFKEPLPGRDDEGAELSTLDVLNEPDAIDGTTGLDVTDVDDPLDPAAPDLGALTSPLSLLEQKHEYARLSERNRYAAEHRRLQRILNQRQPENEQEAFAKADAEIATIEALNKSFAEHIEKRMAWAEAEQAKTDAAAGAVEANAEGKPALEATSESATGTATGDAAAPSAVTPAAGSSSSEVQSSSSAAVASSSGPVLDLHNRLMMDQLMEEVEDPVDAEPIHDIMTPVVHGSRDEAEMQALINEKWDTLLWTVARVRDTPYIELELLPTLSKAKQEEYRVFREQQSVWEALNKEQRMESARAAIRAVRPELTDDAELERLAEDYAVERSAPWNPLRPPLGTEAWSRAQLLKFLPAYMREMSPKLARMHRTPLEAQMAWLQAQAKLSYEFRVAEQLYKRTVAEKVDEYVAKALARTPITELTARAQLMGEAAQISALTPAQKQEQIAHEQARTHWRNLSQQQKEAEAEKAIASGEAAEALEAEKALDSDSYWPQDVSAPDVAQALRTSVVELWHRRKTEAMESKKAGGAAGSAAEAGAEPAQSSEQADRAALVAAYLRSRDVPFATKLATLKRKTDGAQQERELAKLDAQLADTSSGTVMPVLLTAISRVQLLRAPGSEHWSQIPLAALAPDVQKLAAEAPLDFAQQLRAHMFRYDEEVDYELRQPERQALVREIELQQEKHLSEFTAGEMEVFRFHSVEEAHRALLADPLQFHEQLAREQKQWREDNDDVMRILETRRVAEARGILPKMDKGMDYLTVNAASKERMLAEQVNRQTLLEMELADDAELSEEQRSQLQFDLEVTREAVRIMKHQVQQAHVARANVLRDGIPAASGEVVAREVQDAAVHSLLQQDQLQQHLRQQMGQAKHDPEEVREAALRLVHEENQKAEARIVIHEDETADLITEQGQVAGAQPAEPTPQQALEAKDDDDEQPADRSTLLKELGMDVDPAVDLLAAARSPHATKGEKDAARFDRALEEAIRDEDSREIELWNFGQMVDRIATKGTMVDVDLRDHIGEETHPLVQEKFIADPLERTDSKDELNSFDGRDEDFDLNTQPLLTNKKKKLMQERQWAFAQPLQQAREDVILRRMKINGQTKPLESYELANYDDVMTLHERARARWQTARDEWVASGREAKLQARHTEIRRMLLLEEHDLTDIGVDRVNDEDSEILHELEERNKPFEEWSMLELHALMESTGPNAYVLLAEHAREALEKEQDITVTELGHQVRAEYPRWSMEGRLRVAMAWKAEWEKEHKRIVEALPQEKQDLLEPLPAHDGWDFSDAWLRVHQRLGRTADDWTYKLLSMEASASRAEIAAAEAAEKQADEIYEVQRFHMVDKFDLEWEQVLSERKGVIEFDAETRDKLENEYFIDPDLQPYLADEMIPNPHVIPAEEITDEFGHVHTLIEDESELYQPFRTDVSIPFYERSAGSLSEKHALHHFEIKRRPQDEIEHDISELRMWLDNQSLEDHQAPAGKVRLLINEINAWKARQLQPKQEDIATRAKILHEQHKELYPNLVAPPAETPAKSIPVTHEGELVFSPSNPIDMERESTSTLLGVNSEQHMVIREVNQSLSETMRGDQITTDDHPLVLVGPTEIDEDTLYELIMRQVEEYEIVGLDKFGRVLTQQQIDHTPFPLLKKALARVGYLPNPYSDAKAWRTRTIAAGSSDLTNRDAMIELYLTDFSLEGREEKLRERQSYVDVEGNPIRQYMTHEEREFLDDRELAREEEPELLEIMTEEEIALWKSYTTDEGIVQWIANGGLFKTQAAWVAELTKGSQMTAADLEGSAEDLLTDDPTLTFEDNDEQILKGETDRLVDTFMDLKLLQHNPQYYVHYFKNDGSGDFSEEGKKHIMNTLSKIDSPQRRIAYLKALLEWRRVVGGYNVDQDDWTLKKWLQKHAEHAAEQAEQQRKMAGLGKKKKGGADGEEGEGEDGGETEADAALFENLEEQVFTQQDIETGKMKMYRHNLDGTEIPLTQWELEQLPKAKLLSVEEELEKADNSEVSVHDRALGDGEGEEAAEEDDDAGEEGSEETDGKAKKRREIDDENEGPQNLAPDAEHPLLASWARPSTLRHVKELPHMDPARYNEFQAMLHLKSKVVKMLSHHFPGSHNIVVKLNQPQLYYPERKFRQHYANADPMLARAVGGGHSNLQLFQIIFLMRKYRNAPLLAEHVAREIGAAKSHSGVLRSIENVVKRMESIPGLDTGLMIKVSGRINGAAMASHYVIKSGNVPLQTMHANVDYGFAHGYHRIGVFGCKVWLFQRKLDRKEMKAQSLNKKGKY